VREHAKKSGEKEDEGGVVVAMLSEAS